VICITNLRDLGEENTTTAGNQPRANWQERKKDYWIFGGDIYVDGRYSDEGYSEDE